MPTANKPIIPNLWFDRQAEEAAQFYTSVFNNSRVGKVVRAGKAGFETTGLTEGTVMTVEFELEGKRFIGINGGPLFKFNPSISFMLACASKEEVDGIWTKLIEGGSALMELDSYPFSERYGWVQDKYGLSWQVMYSGGRPITQKITPSLMFTGENYGKVEAAINFYTSVFDNSKVDAISRYGKGAEPDREDAINYASFTLDGQQFAAMESAFEHKFTFNEAILLMIVCQTQPEIDYCWDKLTSGGGQESVCGWLKDRFGVSWQVSPTILGEMLGDKDPARVERVTNAFLKMKKFDIAALKKAFEGH